jgi:hypothetical protein
MFLQKGPRLKLPFHHVNSLGRKRPLQLVTQGQGGAGRRIPVSLQALLAGEGRGDGLRPPRARFRGLEGSEGQPERGLGEGPKWRTKGGVNGSR